MNDLVEERAAAVVDGILTEGDQAKAAVFEVTDYEAVTAALAAQPRRGLPSDIAATVAFLASSQAEWITGQTYPVNGGYSFSL